MRILNTTKNLISQVISILYLYKIICLFFLYTKWILKYFKIHLKIVIKYKMECEYCQTVLKTLSSLNQHQKTAKYCLSKQNKKPVKEYDCSFCGTKFTVKSALLGHLRICKANSPIIQEQLQELDLNKKELESFKHKIKEIQIESRKKISERDKIISEQKIIIKELHSEYKNQIERQNKDFHNRLQSMAEKAIDKPSTINQHTTTQIINNLLPITTEHLNDQVQYLTIDHVKHGAVGYAKYALEHPLKDRLVCTDTSRKKGKYKDSDGNIVSDPEMTTITKKLFVAIKDRNSELITEYANDLKVKLDSFGSSDNNEMTNDETVEINGMTDDLVDLVTSVFSQRRQSNEISDGLKPELFHQFVKEIANGSYLSN
jgi:hypothetical protein